MAPSFLLPVQILLLYRLRSDTLSQNTTMTLLTLNPFWVILQQHELTHNLRQQFLTLLSSVMFSSFLLHLLGWLVNNFYRFQVLNSTTPHLYTVLCVRHPKSSLHPSPYTLLHAILPTPDNHHAIIHVHELLLFFLFCSVTPATLIPCSCQPTLTLLSNSSIICVNLASQLVCELLCKLFEGNTYDSKVLF